MLFEVFVVLLAASYVITVALIVLWTGLRRPRSMGEFWRRLKREFLSLTPPA